MAATIMPGLIFDRLSTNQSTLPRAMVMSLAVPMPALQAGKLHCRLQHALQCVRLYRAHLGKLECDSESIAVPLASRKAGNAAAPP